MAVLGFRDAWLLHWAVTCFNLFGNSRTKQGPTHPHGRNNGRGLTCNDKLLLWGFATVREQIKKAPYSGACIMLIQFFLLLTLFQSFLLLLLSFHFGPIPEGQRIQAVLES
jgi:hypothetical protein